MKYIISFCFALIIFLGSDLRAMQPKGSKPTGGLNPTQTQIKLDDISGVLKDIQSHILEMKDQQAKLHEGVDKLKEEINRFKSEEYRDYSGENKNQKTASDADDIDPLFIFQVLSGIMGCK